MSKTSWRGMTVNQLWKRLGKMVAEGHGRRYVCVDKATFRDNREADGVTVLHAHDCRLATINVADDDGWLATNKDGRERLATLAILFGS